MDIIQLLGTAAIITLGTVCLILANPRKRDLFLATGQIVFAWISGFLVVFFLTRIGTTTLGFSTEHARIFNSLSLILSVVGITVSVFLHSRKTRKNGQPY